MPDELLTWKRTRSPFLCLGGRRTRQSERAPEGDVSLDLLASRGKKPLGGLAPRSCVGIGASPRRQRRGLFDAPPAGSEFNDMEGLCGVALGAFHSDDRGQGIIFHHMLAAAHKKRAGQSFSTLHKRSGDCFHALMLTAPCQKVQNARSGWTIAPRTDGTAARDR